jgi:hypothetical protein
MSSTQKQETSASSLVAGSDLNHPALQPFETKDCEHFHVEWTEKGDDIVYHFWPPGENNEFMLGFHRYLEDAFQSVLPPGQHVQADYTSLREAMVQHAHGSGAIPKKDVNRAVVFPRETYYVRVIAGLKNPLSNLFLKDRVFTTIEDKIRERTS